MHGKDGPRPPKSPRKPILKRLVGEPGDLDIDIKKPRRCSMRNKNIKRDIILHEEVVSQPSETSSYCDDDGKNSVSVTDDSNVNDCVTENVEFRAKLELVCS